MKSKLIGAIALLFLLTSSEIATAQDLASQLVGVWKFTVVAQKYVGNEELTKSWGENPGGMMSFSRGGYFINTMHADGRKAPAGAKPTDAELAELFRTIFFGSGTYKVEGDKVILRYEFEFCAVVERDRASIHHGGFRQDPHLDRSRV